MNTMTGVAWFNTMLTALGVPIVMGLVITNNEKGEEKAFLGVGTGENLPGDVKNIIDWGARVRDVDAAKALVLAHGGVLKDNLDWTDVETNKAHRDHGSAMGMADKNWPADDIKKREG